MPRASTVVTLTVPPASAAGSGEVTESDEVAGNAAALGAADAGT
jgi:hypothetical protein